MPSYPVFNRLQIRASADVYPSRVVRRTGTNQGAQVTGKTQEPLGISREWTKDVPVPSASTLHAKSATYDNIAYAGDGELVHADVGTALTSAGLVSGDANGKVEAFVPPGWYVGQNIDPAPADSKVGVIVKIGYIGATLAQSSFSGLKTLTAAGRNGAGAITLTGAAVGDRVVAVFGAPTAGGALEADETLFETTITVADQIQQSSASNLTAKTYIFVLAPALA